MSISTNIFQIFIRHVLPCQRASQIVLGETLTLAFNTLTIKDSDVHASPLLQIFNRYYCFVFMFVSDMKVVSISSVDVRLKDGRMQPGITGCSHV